MEYLSHEADTFCQYAQNSMQISKILKKFHKTFSVLQIKAVEPVGGI